MHDLMLWVHQLLNPSTLMGAVFFAFLFLGLALVGAKIVRMWTRRLISHPRFFVDKTAASFISQLLQLLCFLLAMTVYAHVVPALHKLGTALLTGASVLSVILGLAAQSTLGNLIAGIALLFYRPFEIGDVLVLSTPTGKEMGTVKEFGLGYTKLITDDGRWIVAHNSTIISSILIRIK